MNKKSDMPTSQTKCGARMVGTVKVGEKGQIVIPKEARDALNINPGDNLIVVIKHNKAIGLVKPEDIPTLIAYLQEELAA